MNIENTIIENTIVNEKVGESTKDLGQVFTPNYIVELILNEVDYSGEKILDKSIIEPSFGDGAFLIKIIQRLIDTCRMANKSDEDIKNILNDNIHGIEIDPDLYAKTINKLNTVLNIYGLENIPWKNLVCQNTLEFISPTNFDYVVGNPPYIRIHNIDDDTRNLLKDFSFSDGTTDMYILFFEKCIKMLSEDGKLGFITPNSYLTNSSQKKFRKYLMQENLIKNIINFGSYMVFEDIMTYTAITILEKQKKDFDFTYKMYERNQETFVTNYSTLDFKGIAEQPWNFNTEENTNLLNAIKSRSVNLSKYATIQYGVATNKDAIYIGKIENIKNKKKLVLFKNGYEKEKTFEIEADILKTVIKGSTYNGEENTSNKIIFPYVWDEKTKTYSPLDEDNFKKKYPKAYEYLEQYKSVLEERDLHENTQWYEFGRSQGLNNSRYKKLIIKHIFSMDENKMKVYEVNEDTVVYSGIYITCQQSENIPYIKDILESDEFCKYAKIVGKDMAGNYKSISSNNIKSYGINQFIGKQYFELPNKFDELPSQTKDSYWEEYINKEFISKLQKAYEIAIENPRSTDKIVHIHSYIAEAIQFKLGDSFVIKSHGYDLADGEVKVKGRYYDKNVDISVMKNGIVLGSIGVKLINNNFAQNANNYFENMLGETVNLRINNQPYSQLIVVPEFLPYLNNDKQCNRIEHISDHHIDKYLKLSKENIGLYHRPDLLSVVLITTGNYDYLKKSIETKTPLKDVKKLKESIKIGYANIQQNEHMNDETKQFLKKHINLNDFLNAFVSLILANSYGK